MEKLIIRAITKNEKIRNRYTIYFYDVSYLIISQHEVNHKKLKLDDQMWLLRLLDQGKFLNTDEKPINFFDLPPGIQAKVIIAVRKADKK